MTALQFSSTWRKTARISAGMLIGGAAMALPAMAQSPGAPMLDELERGRWQLVERGGSSAARAVCLGDTSALIQVRHGGNRCRQFVANASGEQVTVGYDCQAAGNGHTTIRRETNRLVQIETQGVVNGAPFAQAFEARRVGSCH